MTGSLNARDVERAMGARADEFLACVQARPDRYAWASGEVSFHFEVDGSGHIAQTHLTHSNIGYPRLETCLREVAAQTQLPVPAGSAETEVGWKMEVAPLGREPEPLEGEHQQALADAVRLHAQSTYENCDLRRDQQFVVTGYVARNGKMIVASAHPPWPGRADAPRDATKLDCLNESLARWKGLPQSVGRRKVSFDLRWFKARPVKKSHGRGPKRRHFR